MFIGLWKDTTLLFIINILDFFKLAKDLPATDLRFLGNFLEPLYVTAIVFWVFAFYLSRVSMGDREEPWTGQRRRRRSSMSEYDRDDKPATGYDETIIDTKGVKVNFGDFWALKGIDISVKEGRDHRHPRPVGFGQVDFHQDAQSPAAAQRLVRLLLTGLPWTTTRPWPT